MVEKAPGHEVAELIVAQSERLIIRRFTVEDSGDLVPILSDPMVTRWLSIAPIKTVDVAERYLQKNYLSKYDAADSGATNEFGLPIDYRFAICLREMGGQPEQLIGRIGISSYGAVNNLGYYLSRAYWGNGYAAEACRLIQSVCRKRGYPYLTATCGEDNVASERVMRASGMGYRYSFFERDGASASVFYQIDFCGEADAYVPSLKKGTVRWVDGFRASEWK